MKEEYLSPEVITVQVAFEQTILDHSGGDMTIEKANPWE